jgi:outer membrane lipoprotein-sorting protein
LLNWKTLYKKAEIKGSAKIGGEDTIVVVVFEPEKGNKDTIYFSTKTFLPVRLESVNSFSTENISLPYSETYSDYRQVDGVMIPFKTVNSSTENGDIVTTIKEIKHNVEIPNGVFRLAKN